MISIQTVISFILTLILGSSALAVNKCATLFSQAQPSAEIQKSIDNSILALAELRVYLDLAKAQGESTLEFTALSANYVSKEKELLAYLEKNNFMTEQELFEKIKAQVKQALNKKENKEDKEAANQEEQSRIQKDIIKMRHASVDGSVMIFNRINPGSFKMGPGGRKVDITISEPFEMMATPTTQVMWKKVIELAQTNNFIFEYSLNIDPSSFKAPTRPVESISFIDLVHWIRHLNKLSEMGDPGLAEIIPGFKKGDKFRIPTSAEWEFVARNRGQYNEKIPTHIPLKDHAWITTGSSERGTQPVAQKIPLIVDGRPFYDLYGNVVEFVAFDFNDLPDNNIDPTVQYMNSTRRGRGGSWIDNENDISASDISAHSLYRTAANLGFRLVREVKP